jgi:hypothetical protein
VSDGVHGEAPDGQTGPIGVAGRADAAEPNDAAGDPEATPVRRALELLVFAPVGVALTVAEDLPALIAKGRQRFEADVRNARVIGEFVVTHGQRDLINRVGKLIHSEPKARTAGSPMASSPPEGSAVPPPPATSAKPEPDPADGAIVDEALAGYDTLSASQVVRRLESLPLEQLRAVHRHEASHRNRRTILNRAHQLLEVANAGAAANHAADHTPDHAADHIGGPPEAVAAEPDRAAE